MAATIEVPALASETIASIGAFDIRNSLLMTWIVMAVFLLICLGARGTKYRLIPGRFQALLELVVEGLYGFFGSIFQNEKMTRRFFPLVGTMFLFIILANWMGILPGVGSIVLHKMHAGEAVSIPLLRSMNADVNTTLVFAVLAIVVAQVFGIASLGISHHASKYFVPPWKKPYGIGTFVGILEFVGEFARIVSFTFRLFGNIFAGEVLLVVISFLIPYIVPIPFMGLEIFVGFIQALVFSMLTSVFIVMAAASHGEQHAPA